MDTYENRTHNVTPQQGFRPAVSQGSSVAIADDATFGTPIGTRGRVMFCMPSANAIADAIIRRALAELRG